MHLRMEIDCALSKMTPKAVPAAPFGLAARQCHADADEAAAVAIAVPTSTAIDKRIMDHLTCLCLHARRSEMRRRAY
jgi:hypothetical protein